LIVLIAEGREIQTEISFYFEGELLNDRQLAQSSWAAWRAQIGRQYIQTKLRLPIANLWADLSAVFTVTQASSVSIARQASQIHRFIFVCLKSTAIVQNRYYCYQKVPRISRAFLAVTTADMIRLMRFRVNSDTRIG
jgi:hypothetical protein